jgi:hypothetical protein
VAAKGKEKEKEKEKKKGNAKRKRKEEEGGEEAKGPQKKRATSSRGPSGDAVSIDPELLDSETVTKKIELLKAYISNFPADLKARMKDTTRQHRVDTQIEEIDACLDTANVKQSNFVLGLWGANGAGKSFLANFLCLSSTPGDGALNSKVIREQGPVRSSQGLDTVSKIPVLLEYGPRIRVTCYKTVGPSHDNEEMLEGAGTVVVDEPSVKTFESFEEAKVFMDSIDPLEVSALTYTGPFLHRSGFKLCDVRSPSHHHPPLFCNDSGTHRNGFTFSSPKTSGLATGHHLRASATHRGQLAALRCHECGWAVRFHEGPQVSSVVRGVPGPPAQQDAGTATAQSPPHRYGDLPAWVQRVRLLAPEP